jgi:hypothetical protein
MEQLKLTKKKLFGTSSEQLGQMVIDQFAHLFNEAEGWNASSFAKETKVKSHTRKRQSGSVEDVVPEGTPVEVVEHRLSDEERVCAICGSEMVEIGKEVRRSLKMKPAQFAERLGHLAAAHLRCAAPSTPPGEGSPRGRNHAAGAERSRENSHQQVLYVAVPHQRLWSCCMSASPTARRKTRKNF